MLTEDQKAYCIALVHAHVSDGAEYSSWVPSYRCVRRASQQRDPSVRFGVPTNMSVPDGTFVSVRVGGHYRRKALYRKLLSALACTCKFDVVSRSGAGALRYRLA